jgi:uncharacterized protein (UPF0147 family)
MRFFWSKRVNYKTLYIVRIIRKAAQQCLPRATAILNRGNAMSEKDDILKQSIDILARIVGDDSVPRNIRRAADEAKTRLLNREDSETVRAAYAISILDDISNDPNMPLHTRTLIWNVVSQLEKAMEGQ